MEVYDSQMHQDDHSDHPREMRGSNERDSPVLTTSFDHNSFLLVNEKEQIMVIMCWFEQCQLSLLYTHVICVYGLLCDVIHM